MEVTGYIAELTTEAEPSSGRRNIHLFWESGSLNPIVMLDCDWKQPFRQKTTV